MDGGSHSRCRGPWAGLVLVVVAGLLNLLSPAAGVPRKAITLSLRNGTEGSTITWDPRETAMLIIDPWSYHWCKTWNNRAFSQHRLLNAATAAGRKAGVTVIWSPTDVEESYIGWPQYERGHNIPRQTPVNVRNTTIPTGNDITPFHTTCECGGSGCMINAGETRMDPLLNIGVEDWIVGGGTPTDVYSVLKHEGIKHIIYMGYAENICVQYKAEGMPNMWKLGFDFVLARDATIAFTGYDQERPWLNPDNGTALITRKIEQYIAKSTEIREFAEAMGTWNLGAQQVFLAPWGNVDRPHYSDGNQTVVVRVSTPCNMTTSCEAMLRDKQMVLALVVTVDGSAPQPPAPGTVIQHGPLHVPVPLSLQNKARPHEGVTLRAVGFGVDQSGKVPPIVAFREANSTIIYRPFELRDVDEVTTDGPKMILMADANLDWSLSSAYYRKVPAIDRSYSGLPFANASLGPNPSGSSKGWPLTIKKRVYPHGLGTWAPMHLEYNLTSLLTAGFTRWVAQVGIDEAYCFNGRYNTNGGFSTAPWMCKDVAEFASATVAAYVDGVLIQQSPVLRLGEGVWPFDIRFAASAKRLRILVLRGPVAQAGKVHGTSREWVVNQDAYDLVDFVNAAFVDDGYPSSDASAAHA